MHHMTAIPISGRVDVLARLSGWMDRCQRELSDRMHAAADEYAHQHSWQVTKSTGRFGFGVRFYRDPRFDDRRRQLSAEAAQVGSYEVHQEPGE